MFDQLPSPSEKLALDPETPSIVGHPICPSPTPQSRRERSSYAYIQRPLPLFLADVRVLRLRVRHYDGLSPDTGFFRVSLVYMVRRAHFFIPEQAPPVRHPGVRYVTPRNSGLTEFGTGYVRFNGPRRQQRY